MIFIMSIKLNQIYCNHFLKNEKLQEFCKNPHFESFSYPCHKVLTSFHIKDSIHYNALISNNYKNYEEYIYTTNQQEHSVEKFLKLDRDFDINKMEKIKVLYNFEKNKYFIQDGVHRLSILLYKKLINDAVPIKYLDVEYDENTINYIKDNLSNTTKKMHYNGWSNRTKYGYHSFQLFNINIVGQRSPSVRLNIFKKHIDFKNKNVLDLGCNSGGMLLHLFEIKNGIGFDYDNNCIKIATDIHKILHINNNIKFFQKDLNNVNLDLDIDINIDIVFLLSLGSWIKNWKYIYEWSIKNSKTIVFESNNDAEGVKQLDLFKENKCDIKSILDFSKDDSTGNYGRKTYIITPPL
jgi:hypothetical protein